LAGGSAGDAAAADAAASNADATPAKISNLQALALLMRTPLSADCTYLTDSEVEAPTRRREPRDSAAGCTNYKDERERITASLASAVVSCG
jgi:hypothetical protein